MTVLEMVLTFVGVPLAVVVLVVGLVYRPRAGSAKRYRPGREYDHAPVWYLARPEKVSVAAAADHVERAASESKALEAKASSDAPAVTSGVKSMRDDTKGGASGNW